LGGLNGCSSSLAKMSLLQELKRIEQEVLQNSTTTITTHSNGRPLNTDLIELVVKNVVWSLVFTTMCAPLPQGETVQSILQSNLNQSGIQVDDSWEGEQVSIIYTIVEDVANGLQKSHIPKLTDDEAFRNILAEERE